jgi:Protein of unknown function (DUF3168)
VILTGLYQRLAADAAVGPLVGAQQRADAWQARIYFSLAAKQAAPPFLVLHVVSALSATTLDGGSDLQEGRIQVDCYAGSQLEARKLSRAVRNCLENYGGPLPEGTLAQFITVNLDMDDPFETGGQGYIFRSVLDFQLFFKEA